MVGSLLFSGKITISGKVFTPFLMGFLRPGTKGFFLDCHSINHWVSNTHSPGQADIQLIDTQYVKTTIQTYLLWSLQMLDLQICRIIKYHFTQSKWAYSKDNCLFLSLLSLFKERGNPLFSLPI